LRCCPATAAIRRTTRSLPRCARRVRL
jgi:hypothetical protein